MPASEFIFPGRKGSEAKGHMGGPAGHGAYPIPDISHARNALARVSQFGSSTEKARVRAAVYAKFPQLKKTTKKSAKQTMK